MLLSLEDEPWRPSRRLFEISAQLSAVAPEISHPMLATRKGDGPRWYNTFPGEHYHLLTALCRVLDPTVVWEFGTDRGMSTVALLEGLRPDALIYTVDIDGWKTKSGSWLLEEDFTSGRVTQVVSDMKATNLFTQYAQTLANSELIFVDGPKDGVTEDIFLELLGKVPFVHAPIVVFDDIRLMSMLYVWRGIQRPKMDITSFGHWSGTGLVDWCPDHSRVKDGAPRTDTNRSGDILVARNPKPLNILILCHHYPNYVPDLLLHGLRKIFGESAVDYPRKDILYDGVLGQPFLEKVPGLMANDKGVDRSDIRTKLMNGFFQMVICDIRAVGDHQELLDVNICPLAIIDGEDLPTFIKPGKHVILRRETDGGDFSIPVPMGMPIEVLEWIDRYADIPKTNSIAFLGSRNAVMRDRNTLLDELLRIFPDALIDSWDLGGVGKWQGRDNYYQSLQSCKVVLSLPGAGSDTFRYWENSACNAAHVARTMPLFIPNDFRDGREIVRFTSIRELAYVVERILSDKDDWREFAARARAWLLTHHTTERRAQTTIDRLSSTFGS